MDTKSGNCSEKCENSDKVGHRLSSSTPNSENCPGCGLNDLDKITITVAPTTGGRFDISVQKNLAIENLKKVISKKLKVPKERILLLHKERQLQEGNLEQNSICNGSTVTLLPSVETGLLSQRPEQGVMQALESLNDSQVNDFLSGKAPLNLTMRLGDHMMLIQLQLSSVTPSSLRKSSSQSSTSNTTSAAAVAASTSAAGSATTAVQKQSQPVAGPSTQADPPPAPPPPIDQEMSLPKLSLISSKLNSLLHENNENLNVLKRKLNEEDLQTKKQKCDNESKSSYLKDLNLKNVLLAEPSTSSSSSTNCNEPATAEAVAGAAPSKTSTESEELQAKKTEILSQIIESVRRIRENTTEMIQRIEGKTCDSAEAPPAVTAPSAPPAKCGTACTCKAAASTSSTEPGKTTPTVENASLDTKALAEASRNLTQTLKQLSSEVLSRPENTEDNSTSTPCTSRRRPGTQGAIIESMQHHGKGVFSGTFSGTLNPALQDRFGRPKRDISTIIHILNDLLCATPQYRRQRQSSQQLSSPRPHVQEAAAVEASTSTGATETVSVENEATRGKLERLRMVMEQNRARRRARRIAKSTNDLGTMELGGVDDLDSNPDGAELMEINPPEPVVA